VTTLVLIVEQSSKRKRTRTRKSLHHEALLEVLEGLVLRVRLVAHLVVPNVALLEVPVDQDHLAALREAVLPAVQREVVRLAVQRKAALQKAAHLEALREVVHPEALREVVHRKAPTEVPHADYE
jgi:hypothetical protein